MQILTSLPTARQTRPAAPSKVQAGHVEAADNSIKDGYLSSPAAAALKPDSYSKVLLETTGGMVQAGGAVAAGGAALGGLIASGGALLLSPLAGSWTMAAGGAVGLAASIGVGSMVANLAERSNKRAEANRPEKPAAPEASQMPGGETSSAVVLEKALAENKDLYENIRPGWRSAHPGPDGSVYTYGYEGATLGHMHSRSSLEMRQEEVRAEGAIVQRNVNLTISAVAGAGAAFAAATGHGLVGLGLGGVSGLMLFAAHGCQESRQTALALVDAHRTSREMMEQFGRQL